MCFGVLPVHSAALPVLCLQPFGQLAPSLDAALLLPGWAGGPVRRCLSSKIPLADSQPVAVRAQMEQAEATGSFSGLWFVAQADASLLSIVLAVEAA